jgi:hypothetical protein
VRADETRNFPYISNFIKGEEDFFHISIPPFQWRLFSILEEHYDFVAERYGS